MLCNAVQCSAMQCNAARRWSFVRYVTGTIDEFGRWRRGMCASSVRSSSRSGRGRKLTLTSHHPTQHTGTILSVYLWTPSIVGGRARRSAVLVSSHTTTEWRRKSQSLSQSSAIPIPSLRRFRAPLPIITADHNSTGFFDASMACLVLSMTVYGSTVIRLWGFVRVALIRPTDQVTLMASRAWSHGRSGLVSLPVAKRLRWNHQSTPQSRNGQKCHEGLIGSISSRAESSAQLSL